MTVRRRSRVPRLGVMMLALAFAACTPGDGPAAGGDAQADADAPMRTPPILQEFNIGGDFVLTAHDGTVFDLAAHRGEVFLLFFGYTNCPDFCPATLSLLGQVYELLGEDAAAVQTLFVSIDPLRDTPEKLAQYLDYFSVPAIGLTGTAEELEPVLTAYAGLMEVERDANDAIVIGHTTYTYLIDQDGRVRYTFRANDTPQFIAHGVAEQVGIARGLD
jgi:protein SCO1/2